jgi:hypothetical protein
LRWREEPIRPASRRWETTASMATFVLPAPFILSMREKEGERDGE